MLKRFMLTKDECISYNSSHRFYHSFKHDRTAQIFLLLYLVTCACPFLILSKHPIICLMYFFWIILTESRDFSLLPRFLALFLPVEIFLVQMGNPR